VVPSIYFDANLKLSAGLLYLYARISREYDRRTHCLLRASIVTAVFLVVNISIIMLNVPSSCCKSVCAHHENTIGVPNVVSAYPS
jgi:hypothetical protein